MQFNYLGMIIILSIGVGYGLTLPASATFSHDDEVQVLKVRVVLFIDFSISFFMAIFYMEPSGL
jgi:hypothetical protein